MGLMGRINKTNGTNRRDETNGTYETNNIKA